MKNKCKGTIPIHNIIDAIFNNVHAIIITTPMISLVAWLYLKIAITIINEIKLGVYVESYHW